MSFLFFRILFLIIQCFGSLPAYYHFESAINVLIIKILLIALIIIVQNFYIYLWLWVISSSSSFSIRICINWEMFNFLNFNSFSMLVSLKNNICFLIVKTNMITAFMLLFLNLKIWGYHILIMHVLLFHLCQYFISCLLNKRDIRVLFHCKSIHYLFYWL